MRRRGLSRFGGAASELREAGNSAAWYAVVSMVKRRLAVALTMAMATAAGCAGGGAATLTAAGPAQAEVGRCGRWVLGAAAALGEQRVVILGGGQGTAEAPRFAGELACQLGKGKPVVLALPFPRQLDSALNLFLGGSASAEARLRAHGLWTAKETVDEGLASQAMWELLIQLKAWRAAGLPIEVLAFGPDFDEGGDGYQYDASYERYLQSNALGEELRKNGDATFVVWLSADAGSRTAKVGGEASMAATLAESGTTFTSFRIEEPGAATAPWSLERREKLEGYDGVFRLGPTTASPQLPPAGEPEGRSASAASTGG